MTKEELINILESMPDNGEVTIRFDYVGADNVRRLETSKPEVIVENGKVVLYVNED